MIKIGNEGLCEAMLIIPQGCSQGFTVVHEDTEGNIIDYRGATAKMVLQTMDRKKMIIDLSSYVSGRQEDILVQIPGNATKNIAPGEYAWDLIMTNGSNTTRLLYGVAEIVDTYSLDEVRR